MVNKIKLEHEIVGDDFCTVYLLPDIEETHYIIFSGRHVMMIPGLHSKETAQIMVFGIREMYNFGIMQGRKEGVSRFKSDVREMFGIE